MKKIASIFLSVAIMAMMVACSKDDDKSSQAEKTAQVEPTVVVESLMTELGLSEFESCDEEFLSLFYTDIDVSKLESFSVMYEASGGYADEVGVFKVKNQDDVKYMEDILNARVETRTNDFTGYAPDEVTKLENSVVTSKGNYVMICVADGSDKSTEIFEDELEVK